MRSRWLLAPLVPVLLLAVAERVQASAAQGGDASVDAAISAAIEEAERLYMDQAPRSLASLESSLHAHPEHFELLWRASRGAFALGVMEEVPQVRDEFYERAVHYAERARLADSTRIEGHFWRTAARGRQALHSGITESAGVAAEVYAGALEVLAMDSLYAPAHHLLGKLSYEIVILSGVKRFFGRRILGDSPLADAGWEDARRHYERAVALHPHRILYRVDLALLYIRRDLPDLARAQLREALDLPAIHPYERGIQEEARELVAELGVP